MSAGLDYGLLDRHVSMQYLSRDSRCCSWLEWYKDTSHMTDVKIRLATPSLLFASIMSTPARLPASQLTPGSQALFSTDSCLKRSCQTAVHIAAPHQIEFCLLVLHATNPRDALLFLPRHSRPSLSASLLDPRVHLARKHDMPTNYVNGLVLKLRKHIDTYPSSFIPTGSGVSSCPP